MQLHYGATASCLVAVVVVVVRETGVGVDLAGRNGEEEVLAQPLVGELAVVVAVVEEVVLLGGVLAVADGSHRVVVVELAEVLKAVGAHHADVVP